jgi:hypothetical protein
MGQDSDVRAATTPQLRQSQRDNDHLVSDACLGHCARRQVMPTHALLLLIVTMVYLLADRDLAFST